MKLHVITQEGQSHALEGVEGWRLMEVIRDYKLPIKAECGGCLACATCHVYVDAGWADKIPLATQDEKDQLLDNAFEVEDNSRLSCQIILDESMDGLTVTLAPGSEP